MTLEGLQTRFRLFVSRSDRDLSWSLKVRHMVQRYMKQEFLVLSSVLDL